MGKVLRIAAAALAWLRSSCCRARCLALSCRGSVLMLRRCVSAGKVKVGELTKVASDGIDVDEVQPEQNEQP